MKVLIVADGHYYVDKHGVYYVETVFDRNFYARYLMVFDEIYAIVRAEKVDIPPKDAKKASGDGIHFLPLPPSRGFYQYIRNFLINKKLILKYIDDVDFAIFRLPGVIPNMVSKNYIKHKKEFAVEVVVDPWEYFAPGTTKGVTRPFVRLIWKNYLKKMCMQARGTSYVTDHYLQNIYPCKAMMGVDRYYTGSYSSVELPDDSFVSPKVYNNKDSFKIIHVANSFSGYGKGHLVLMEALVEVLKKMNNVSVTFVGDGVLRKEFEKFAEIHGIADHVLFTGRLSSGDAVRKEMRAADLFVFPTRAEGLPRVLLEAMAEGLPVIASPVCGIPEILEDDYLVQYDDVTGYAKKIIELLNDPEQMTLCSKRNFEKAQEFKSSRLNEKRCKFYTELLRYIESVSSEEQLDELL